MPIPLFFCDGSGGVRRALSCDEHYGCRFETRTHRRPRSRTNRVCDHHLDLVGTAGFRLDDHPLYHGCSQLQRDNRECYAIRDAAPGDDHRAYEGAHGLSRAERKLLRYPGGEAEEHTEAARLKQRQREAGCDEAAYCSAWSMVLVAAALTRTRGK